MRQENGSSSALAWLICWGSRAVVRNILLGRPVSSSVPAMRIHLRLLARRRPFPRLSRATSASSSATLSDASSSAVISTPMGSASPGRSI